MRRLACLVLLCGACGPRVARLPTYVTVASDGGRLAEAGPVRFGVVGTSTGEVGHLVADLTSADLDFLVGLGLVERSTTRAWLDWDRQWGELARSVPVVAVPGPGDRRRDPDLAGLRHAFPDAGVRNVGVGVAWHHFDVRTHGRVWRVLALDSAPKGPTLQEQQYWVPKVVSKGDDFDHLLVLAGDPPTTLSRASTDGSATRALLGAVRDHGDIMHLMGVFCGGSQTNEIGFPGGSWGEALVNAGLGAGEGTSLQRAVWVDGERLTLDPGFDAALQAEAEARFGVGSIDIDWPADRFPLRGWWLVTLDGRDISLRFRMERPDGTFQSVYQVAYTPQTGWQ